MSTPSQWATGHARQAQADFDTWNRLQSAPAIPECHRLLFLQMACEKLTKAHLCREGADPIDVQTSHAYTAKNLPIIIRQQLVGTTLQPTNIEWIVRHSKHLAQEIELLAPAVQRGGRRPDNCEYPWDDANGELHVPIDRNFTPSQLLTISAGRTFLKLIRDALRELIQADEARGHG